MDLIEELKKDRMFLFFLKEKPALTLLCLREQNKKWFASLVAKKIDCTYPHIVKIISIFKELGLIEIKSAGRQKNITLTDKGSDLAHDLKGLARTFVKLNEEEKRKSLKNKPLR